jgi:hypothetical protein
MTGMPGTTRKCIRIMVDGKISLIFTYFSRWSQYTEQSLWALKPVTNTRSDSEILFPLQKSQIVSLLNQKCWQLLNMELPNMNINEALTTPEREWLH